MLVDTTGSVRRPDADEAREEVRSGLTFTSEEGKQVAPSVPTHHLSCWVVVYWPWWWSTEAGCEAEIQIRAAQKDALECVVP